MRLLKDENDRLQSEILSKQQQVDAAVSDLRQLKAKYDGLKTARTITAASVDVEVARINYRNWCGK